MPKNSEERHTKKFESPAKTNYLIRWRFHAIVIGTAIFKDWYLLFRSGATEIPLALGYSTFTKVCLRKKMPNEKKLQSPFGEFIF